MLFTIRLLLFFEMSMFFCYVHVFVSDAVVVYDFSDVPDFCWGDLSGVLNCMFVHVFLFCV